MSNIKQLQNVPEISFIENLSLQETEAQLIEQYSRLFRQLTGREPSLSDSDTRSLIIKSFALIEYQTMQYIDAKGRLELLKTSTGEGLDNIAALFGITRMGATYATAVERFTLSAPRADVVAVPAGTRVKTQNSLYFNTLEYAEIPAGETHVDVTVQAEEAGKESSGLLTDTINVLVDPIPYMASVTNITESVGGIDEESDDDLTERTYLAPGKFSVAGPKDAYEYYVREWRADVGDVQIVSPSPCVVSLYVVLEDGSLLTEEERQSLVEYINGDAIRPLTDKVICEPPDEVEYNINYTYWIAQSDQKSAGTIQAAVQQATTDYTAWQRKLGLDINPTELIARLRTAGAKRVKLTAPDDVTIGKTQIPKCAETTILYGGLEDD